MNNKIFVGENEYLLDITKIYNNYSFFKNPTIDDFTEIISQDLTNKIVIIFIEKDVQIDRKKIAENISDNIILLIEKTSFVLNFSFINLTPEKLCEIVAKHLDLEKYPIIHSNVFDNLYKYQILGYLPETICDFEFIDAIKFFRIKLFELQKNQLDARKVFLKSVLYRLEYSFKLTGIKGLSTYFMIMEKIL